MSKPVSHETGQWPTPAVMPTAGIHGFGQGQVVALGGLRAGARRTAAGRRRAAEPEFGTPESVGVDQGTLDAIASCESGGDPTVVDSSGIYRGKYQFDMQTWASVGGSGDPAAFDIDRV